MNVIATQKTVAERRAVSVAAGSARPAARPTYRARLTREPADIRAAQALRFQVFNLELNEGLERSYKTGLDADLFDEVFDHLIVEEMGTADVVGAYRLQPGRRAREMKGYYSEQEFDFRPFEPMRHEMVELGRAAIHREHRSLAVLSLLWRGIATYARERNCRYLVGCTSLTSRDPGAGAAAYEALKTEHLARLELRTEPLAALACPLGTRTPEPITVPKLLMAYLSMGAKICGAPAIDREFGTIDFLTVLDFHELPARARNHFLAAA